MMCKISLISWSCVLMVMKYIAFTSSRTILSSRFSLAGLTTVRYVICVHMIYVLYYYNYVHGPISHDSIR